ncbi:putative fimbrial subunit PilA [Fulvimarina pelagi HTCC2506]|uniref:Putative fimbrial subunit PilA n=2 Tax=Fulvimarina pelagi TaxID=217511 RepID=Q0FZ67_9HYPH|nr:hypothetical protein [Fulvimarina pelagi]EAU40411.1 putative fimbrial subunit PilA [Fulvimarina pelagi HTCC2506]BAT31444.1 putative fimbrial subunit PilA [Fulvimarina pelagi]
MTIDDANQDEKPLDPAAERLRRKLVRLLVFSMGFLILSVMTVFGVIIYRTMGAPAPQPARTGDPIAIALPAGAEIVYTAIDEGRILLTVRQASGISLFSVSEANGEILAEYRIEPVPTDPNE